MIDYRGCTETASGSIGHSSKQQRLQFTERNEQDDDGEKPKKTHAEADIWNISWSATAPKHEQYDKTGEY